MLVGTDSAVKISPDEGVDGHGEEALPVCKWVSAVFYDSVICLKYLDYPAACTCSYNCRWQSNIQDLRV